jgi:hypothetical protein
VDEGQRRYVAFLSYSHRDAAAARALHRRLESYRIPRRLVGSEGERGPVPTRLVPIFRDREELPAAGDLSERVRAALAVSDSLIILCSPAAAASLWVAKEIDTFRALHPDRPVIAAILAGEPAEAFPPNLAAGGAEPLAADLRPGRDGRRLGFLKLVAGLSGVGLDALVQRDAQRRLRRVTAVTGVAVAAMLAMAILTAVALTARAEAERQRAEAEGLVEFMLTDLRTKLKGVRRLDVFVAVNQRALRHYQGQNLADLPADSLERRARLLHAIGEDELDAGQSGPALAHFNEAARTTGQLLAEQPSNQDRVFAQSQSEYWIGAAAYRSHDLAAAKRGFERYRRLAERLVALDPRNAAWLKESGFAAGSLCTIALETPRNPDTALRLCAQALDRMEQAQRILGNDPATLEALLNRHLWMMKAWSANDRWDRVEYHLARQEVLVTSLLRGDPKNVDYRDIWMKAQVGIADLLLEHGDRDGGLKRLRAAGIIAKQLHEYDPQNREWRSWDSRITERLNKGEG